MTQLNMNSDTVSSVHYKAGQDVYNFKWHKVKVCADTIAERVRESGVKYSSIYGVPRGGLVVAVLLSHRLNIPVVWRCGITPNTLIVDDVEDSGNCLKHLLDIYPKCDCAVLITKRLKRTLVRYWGAFTTKEEWIMFPWED